MGGDTPLSGLAFDILVEILPGTGFWWQVAANAANWVYTNLNGMLFGIFFGACLLTGFSLLQRRSFNHPFLDTALGASIGTPLGVCVNCAAPVAQGLHTAGMRLETTLAALVASPTLNAIVVSMSFALLPGYIAAIKLLAMLGFIFIGIPFLCRFVFQRENAPERQIKASLLPGHHDGRLSSRALQWILPQDNLRRTSDNIIPALAWVSRNFARNLLFITMVTVPLMLLAGALGAFLVTALPFNTINHAIAGNAGPLYSVIKMLAVTAIAIVLPVPIAFDVILAAILIEAGWPAMYAVPLLLGLGSFSIYSFLIIGRAISFRVAGVVLISLAGIAFSAGVLAKYLEQNLKVDAWSAVSESLAATPVLELPKPDPSPGLSDQDALRLIAPNRVRTYPYKGVIQHSGTGVISVRQAVLQSRARKPGASQPPFSRLPGHAIGLSEHHQPSPLSVFEPFAYFNAIAAGDVHGDGWIDVVMASDVTRGGLSLYTNVGGIFVRQTIKLGPLRKSFVNAVALVDLNNDGKLDLFVSTFLDGAHIFWNLGGRFSADNRMTLPNGDAAMIGAPAFADLDGDGKVDIIAGNWLGGATFARGGNHTKRSRDRILWNEGTHFRPMDLTGLPGETLTTLVTDLDGNGKPDIIIGDDMAFSDKVYINRGNRTFTLLKKSDALIPWLTKTTMSLDQGDINNDLHPELYAAQIAQRVSNERAMPAASNQCAPWLLATGPQPAHASTCYLPLRNSRLAYSRSLTRIPRCTEIKNAHYRAVCAARSVIFKSVRERQPGACNAISSSWPYVRRICTMAASAPRIEPQKYLASGDALPGVDMRNILLTQKSPKSFKDVTNSYGVAKPGWSWNAKFVDLDQDGWQDLFVATGFLQARSHSPNAFYRNIKGKRFESRSSDFGLGDRVPTTSYAAFDFDRDGSIDIIRAPTIAGTIVHRNTSPAGASLVIRLADQIGNSNGIGAKIVVHTDQPGTGRQIREIKASGGFASFDPLQAHFGLGKARHVTKIVVTWRDGAITEVSGPLPVNAEIFVRRDK